MQDEGVVEEINYYKNADDDLELDLDENEDPPIVVTKNIATPSQERKKHFRTHLPYRDWCEISSWERTFAFSANNYGKNNDFVGLQIIWKKRFRRGLQNRDRLKKSYVRNDFRLFVFTKKCRRQMRNKENWKKI